MTRPLLSSLQQLQLEEQQVAGDPPAQDGRLLQTNLLSSRVGQVLVEMCLQSEERKIWISS